MISFEENLDIIYIYRLLRYSPNWSPGYATEKGKAEKRKHATLSFLSFCTVYCAWYKDTRGPASNLLLTQNGYYPSTPHKESFPTQVAYYIRPNVGLPIFNQSNLFNKRTTRPLTLQYKQYIQCTVNTIIWTN